MELAVTNNDFHLDDNIWNRMPEILTVLKIFDDKTKYLQTEDLTVSDAFAVWFELKAHFQNIPNWELATLALEVITIRENMFSKNEVIFAGVYLDPRFRVLLNEEQKSKAVDHLIYLHQKQTQKGDISSSSAQQSCVENPTETQRQEGDDVDVFEKYLRGLEAEKHAELQQQTAHSSDFETQLRQLMFLGV